MAEKRKDSRGRILRDGESQRADGRYRYQYMDSRGKRQEVYSWKLVETDRTPSGKRDDLSLREKEKQIQKDLADGIMVTMADKATLNDMFHLYMSGKSELKQSSRASYFYTYQKYVSKTIGYKKITEIKFSHIKRFYSDLLKNRKFKPNSLKLVHSIIHPVFMLAVPYDFFSTQNVTFVKYSLWKYYNKFFSIFNSNFSGILILWRRGLSSFSPLSALAAAEYALSQNLSSFFFAYCRMEPLFCCTIRRG